MRKRVRKKECEVEDNDEEGEGGLKIEVESIILHRGVVASLQSLHVISAIQQSL